MINGRWDGTMGIGMGMGMGIGIGMGIGTMGWDNGHWDGMGWDGIGMGLGFNELWAASLVTRLFVGEGYWGRRSPPFPSPPKNANPK